MTHGNRWIDPFGAPMDRRYCRPLVQRIVMTIPTDMKFDFSKNSDAELVALARQWQAEANEHEAVRDRWQWLAFEAKRQIEFANQVIADHDHAASLARAESRRRIDAAIASGTSMGGHGGVG